MRPAASRSVVVVTNFTPVPRDGYVLPLPQAGHWREILNTDAAVYGGSGRAIWAESQAEAVPSHGKPASAKVTLAAAGNLVFHAGRIRNEDQYREGGSMAEQRRIRHWRAMPWPMCWPAGAAAA